MHGGQGMDRANIELQVVAEERVPFQAGRQIRFHAEGKIKAAFVHQLGGGVGVHRRDVEGTLREALAKLQQHGRQKVLAGARGRGNAQGAASPLLQRLHFLSCGTHLSEHALGMAQQALACRGEHCVVSAPLKQGASHL